MADLFDPDAEYDARPTDELVDLAWADRRSVALRARAVTALGRRCADDPSLVDVLADMGRDEGMREARMFELVSLAYLAVAGLVHSRRTEAVEAAREVAADLPESDRRSLQAFLRSGDLALDPG